MGKKASTLFVSPERIRLRAAWRRASKKYDAKQAAALKKIKNAVIDKIIEIVNQVSSGNQLQK